MKSEGTRPERRVQSALIALGVHGWETNDKSLPGSPDIAITKLRKAVFVHGCFWHVHSGCPGMRVPHKPGRNEYWWGKLAGNVLRDRRCEQALLDEGWEVLVVWECETVDRDALMARLAGFIGVPDGGGKSE